MSQFELRFDSGVSIPVPNPIKADPQRGTSGGSIPPSLPDWARARALQQRAESILRNAGYPRLADTVHVRWNRRMRSTAGAANHRLCMVTLNPCLIPFGENEVDTTLRHELAHLLAHHRSGRRRIAPHGPEWRQACADLGIAGEARCHTLPLPRREIARRYRYRCNNCGAEFGRVKPLRRASACLACCRKYSKGKYDDRFRFVRIVPA